MHRSDLVLVLSLALAPVALVVLLGLAGCRATGGERAGTGDPRDPAAAARARSLYDGLCASCHGDDGRGTTPQAKRLDPPPGDLQSCNFKYRSTVSGTLPHDSDLLRTVAIGIPGTRMPSFSSTLLEPSLETLLGEIKRRCRAFAVEGPGPQLPWPSRRLPAADSERGRAVFERERCRACHGDSGRGDGPGAAVLKDAAGRRIRPRDFTKGSFRSGYALVDVVRAFSTGLDGTPMPALAEGVPEAERWALAGYLATLGRDREGRPRHPMAAPPFWYARLMAWGAASTSGR